MGNQLREGSTLSTRVETGHQKKGLTMRCSADSSHKQLLTDVNTSSDNLGLESLKSECTILKMVLLGGKTQCESQQLPLMRNPEVLVMVQKPFALEVSLFQFSVSRLAILVGSALGHFWKPVEFCLETLLQIL